MTRFVSRLGLPLLAKELIEQSARKRTYVIRVLYALILFFIAFLFFYEKLVASVTSPLAVLGTGRELFTVLVMLGYAGIYLFMPAITCGVITQEKERASLQLLFLTRLGPWAILFEKLLGRLVPMLGFLLLSLPLLGFAYTLGGISQELLWTGIWFLVLAAIQMGTLALACSAFFRTTVASFVSSYVISFLMMFGPYMAWMTLFLVAMLLGVPDRTFFSGTSGPSFAMMLLFMAPFFGVAWFLTLENFPGALGYWLVVAHSVVILSASSACLIVARRALVRRAFLPARNRVRELLSAVDRQVFRIDERPQDSRSPVPSDSELLPADKPITWRETTKRSLGRPRYLFLILLIIETPLLIVFGLLFLGTLAHDTVYPAGTGILGLLWALLWLLAVLIVSVRAASLIAGERSHQTLDVLCVTPLTGREILLQKMQGVWRLVLLFAVPFATLFCFQVLWTTLARSMHRNYGWHPEFDPVLYLVCAFLGVAVYLPLTAWLSLLVGLLTKTQARAIIGSLAAIVTACAAPLILIVMPLSIIMSLPGSSSTETSKYLAWVSLTSPASIVFMNEFNILASKDFPGPWLAVLLNFGFFGAIAVAIRALCLASADRWLGRTETNASSSQAPADPAPTGDCLTRPTVMTPR